MVRLPHYKFGEEYLARRSRDGSGSLLQKSLSRRLAGRMLLVLYGDPSGDVVAAHARDGKEPLALSQQRRKQDLGDHEHGAWKGVRWARVGPALLCLEGTETYEQTFLET